MKKFFLLLASFALLLTSSSSAFPTKQTDRAIKRLTKEFQTVGVSAIIVKDGKIVYNKAFGYKDLESKEPLRNDDLMRIASISKSFTATAFMQLVEQGKVSLDDDISDLMGFRIRNPHFPDTPITLKMVLSHTASFNDKGGYATLDKINPAINGDCVEGYRKYEPGKGYRYSNLGLNLAGAILEKVTGVRFDKYIKKQILDPLGMYGGYNVDMLDRSKFVNLYNLRKGKFVKSNRAYRSLANKMPTYVLGYSAPLFSPTGGMTLSAQELATYMMMHMNYGEYNGVRIISEESAKLMQTPVWNGKGGDHYGLCLKEFHDYIDDDKYRGEGRVLIGHTGTNGYGFKGIILWSPADNWGIILMISGHTANRDKDIRKIFINAIYNAGLKK